MMSLVPEPDASLASSSNSLSCCRPGWGWRSASAWPGSAACASSRSTPSSRRISVRPARAVSPISSSRRAPAAGIPGVASRAVSACTAIMEIWCATTSCSSRAMRARSPRAVCSTRVPAMTCRAVLCASASLRARCAIPVRAAAGASEASSTTRTSSSEPVCPVATGPASASTRNGTARAGARNWAVPHEASVRRLPLHAAPLRPSRYKTMSSATRPATVSVWKAASESMLAAQIATAAAVGPRKASGTVVNSASAHTPTRPAALIRVSAPRASASVSAAIPSRAPVAAGAWGDAANRRPLSGHPLLRSPAAPMSIMVDARPGHRVTPAGDTAVPLARDAPQLSLVPATAKTAPRRDDRPGRRSLALPDMEATIEVSGLRKRFGPTLALDGMSFTVGPGQVTGFVGPNGAGKSTTMRVILGLDAADQGTALVGGRPYASLRQPMRVLGSLLDAGALQPSRTARNHLLWLAHSQGLTARRVDEVIEQAGLENVARRRAGGYSLGMRQRLGIAAAMLANPAAIMLDEPFNGMDPEGIVWMRGYLRSLAADGRAVLVSSHLMSELQDTADHLVVVGRGKVIADATMSSLLAAASGDQVTLRTTAPGHATEVLRSAGAQVAANGPDALLFSGISAERAVALLSSNAVPFSEVSAHRASLEQAYLELTRQAVEFRPPGFDSGAGRAGQADQEVPR